MKLEQLHDHRVPTGVLGLAITQDGATAFAACMDGTIQEIDTATGSRTPFHDGHGSFASGCVLTPDGRSLLSAGYDGMLLWHDRTTRRAYRRVQAHRFWSWRLALSPDGRYAATCTGQYLPGGWKYEPAPEQEPSVRIFEVRSGQEVAARSLVPPVLSVAFSPDSRYLAAANMTGDVRVWSLDRPDPPTAWSVPDFTSWGRIKSHHFCGGIYGLTFSPDGETLLACGMGPMTDPMAGNGRMTWQRWVWREDPPRKVDQIRGDDAGAGLMETIACHPSGSHFLMAGRQAQGTWNAAAFDAADGRIAHSMDTKSRITQAQFTADGSRLILAGATGQSPPDQDGNWPDYGRLQVWNVTTAT